MNNLGDYIAVRIAQVFIVVVFAMGMVGLVNDLITGRLPL
jgi:hypothetical protein